MCVCIKNGKWSLITLSVETYVNTRRDSVWGPVTEALSQLSAELVVMLNHRCLLLIWSNSQLNKELESCSLGRGDTERLMVWFPAVFPLRSERNQPISIDNNVCVCVVCVCVGYGQTGPRSQSPGYDSIASAVSGMMHITGPEVSFLCWCYYIFLKPCLSRWPWGTKLMQTL